MNKNIVCLATAVLCALALALTPEVAAAKERHDGWTINFTPVLMFADDKYRFGGGVDPELRYTLDLGGARLSAGARVGGYYAKNLFGMTMMPTLRLTVPVGPVEPYVAFGMGYGWLPRLDHADFATMSRLGVVFRFSESFAIGVEARCKSWMAPIFGSRRSGR
jgi:hypothetical protein